LLSRQAEGFAKRFKLERAPLQAASWFFHDDAGLLLQAPPKSCAVGFLAEYHAHIILNDLFSLRTTYVVRTQLLSCLMEKRNFRKEGDSQKRTRRWDSIKFILLRLAVFCLIWATVTVVQMFQ
jgi:hypothetical protein